MAACLQRNVQVYFERLKDRGESENNSGQDRKNKREEKRGSVDSSLAQTRNVDIRWSEAKQRSNCPLRHEETKRTTNEGQQQVFDQQLTDEPHTPGTDGSANGKFFLSFGRAGELQVSDITAGDEHETAGCSEKEQHHRHRASEAFFVDGQNARAHTAVRSRMIAFHLTHQSRDVASGC